MYNRPPFTRRRRFLLLLPRALLRALFAFARVCFWQTQDPAGVDHSIAGECRSIRLGPPTVGLEQARRLLTVAVEALRDAPQPVDGLPAHSGHRARSARAASVGTTTRAT